MTELTPEETHALRARLGAKDTEAEAKRQRVIERITKHNGEPPKNIAPDGPPDQANATIKQEPIEPPVNSAQATLSWAIGVFLLAGLVLLVTGTNMDTVNPYSGVPSVDGIPALIWGAACLNLGVLAIFSRLIVAAVRWQAPVTAPSPTAAE